ncbi:MAG: class I SAM-dependent methyltransferase [Candidatus Pacebacteria bacterium]|nr:class I SAM-dependent methyltransferase [Candidatus Paceibacterota bacterium]
MESSIKIEIAKNLKTIENEVIVPSASKKIRLKKFENNKCPYLITLPLMWLLIIYVMIKKFIYKILGLSSPKINTFFFDGIGKSSRKVKEYAASWKALDIVYNHPFPYTKDIGNLVDEYYWNGLNCQALRNRRKLTKEELRNIILSIKKQEIKIISLACGSAEVLIEIMAELKHKGIKIKALLVDIDEDALKRAKELAKQYDLLENIETEKNSIYSIIEITNKFKPDIIEMIGFIDYLKQEDAIKLTEKIKKSLNPDGYFITCNINNNPEQYFLTWVINWPMIYRKPKDLMEIAIKAGFTSQRIIYEPLKIHGILIAKK